VVQSLEKAFDNVRALLRLAQLKARAAPDDVHPVLLVLVEKLLQRERLGAPLTSAMLMNAEARLERRELEELVDDDLLIGVGFQLNHEADLLVAFVADVGNAADAPVLHGVRNRLDDGDFRFLVRQLGEDDRILPLRLLDLGFGPDGDQAFPVL
jgi:hypothetical protein